MEDHFTSHPRFTYPLLSRLGMLFLLFFIGMFLGQGLLQIWLMQDGQDLETLLSAVRSGDSKNNAIILLMQAFNQIFGFGCAVLIAGKLHGDTHDIMPIGKPNAILILSALILVLLCFPILPFISWNAQSFVLPESFKNLESILKSAEADAEALLNGLTQGENAVPKFIQIVVFAGLPAICEELFFRGAIQHYFQKRFTPNIAIWLTGLIFSLIHFQVYGFFARFLLGVLFGYLVVWSGSLVPAMFGHFVFNASSLWMSWQNEGFMNDETNPFPWYIGILALCSLILVVFFFHRYCLKRSFYESEV
jgi:membrane protease YdiL (CAAX protease family)